MTNFPVSYRNAAVRGVPVFEALDTITDQQLLAGSEPELSATTRILMEDSITLASFSVVGLSARKRLALATAAAVKAAHTFGAGNAALILTAVDGGVAGNDISAIILASDTTAAVTVDGHQITITPLTGGATATAVAALVNADEAAHLLVTATAGGTGGSNVVAAGEAQLTGGADIIAPVGVLFRGIASAGSNTTIHGETFLSGNFNAGADSPLVWDASFDTLAKKVGSVIGNPSLVFRSRLATGSPAV